MAAAAEYSHHTKYRVVTVADLLHFLLQEQLLNELNVLITHHAASDTWKLSTSKNGMWDIFN